MTSADHVQHVVLQLTSVCVMWRTAVFLSTAQGQLATIQESFYAPVAVHTVTAALETSAVSEAGEDDSIIA